MHIHTDLVIQCKEPQGFLFFMPGVWAVSQSHHAQHFLIRGTWDWGTASLSPSLLSCRWVWLSQRCLERGRDMNIFMADNAYFWHIVLRFSDKTDKMEEERKDLPQNWAVNEEPDSVCVHTHTHIHARTHSLENLSCSYQNTSRTFYQLSDRGKGSQENSMLHSGPLLLFE